MSLDAIFKAYDVRGKVGTELVPEVSNRIGKAYAEWLPLEGPVAVGRDMRPDSKELADALVEGLLAQGRDVWDIGEVTSDMIYYAVGDNNLAGGVMITASHNPGEYNGIKFCKDQAQGVAENTGLKEVKELAEANNFAPATTPGKLIEKDVVEGWIEHVLSFINVKKLSPLRIVADAGNGMAGKIFAELEPYVPFEVEELYFELDGTFPNHIANPLELKNLVDVQKVIKDQKLDAGVAFDGDGDRAVLLDENAEPVTATVLSCLLSEFFLKHNPGSTILLNIICGQVAVQTVEKNGGKVIRTRVGHSFIKNDMKEYNAIFAAEHSGHYYFKDNYRADSGLIAAIIGLYILGLSKKKLSDLVAPYRKAYVQIQETNFEVSDTQSMIDKLKDTFKDQNINLIDGLTVNFSNGSWFNVRPSNTEPLLRLNAEAKNNAELDKLVEQIKQIITS
jgi:phosphomannomutase